MSGTFPNALNGSPKLIFLPGLGIDQRLFKYQLPAFPGSVVLNWIRPDRGESLEHYARRWADSLPPDFSLQKPDEPVLVCGLSLGGMVAPYFAEYLKAAGFVRLCTVRGYEEFPLKYYPGWLLLKMCPPLGWMVFFAAQWFARFLLLFSSLWSRFLDPDVLRAYWEMDTGTLVRLNRMMLDWAYRPRSTQEKPVAEGFPTFQIHGTRDPLLPIRRTRPDVIVPGGRHLLTLTHPDRINSLLREFVDGL